VHCLELLSILFNNWVKVCLLKVRDILMKQQGNLHEVGISLEMRHIKKGQYGTLWNVHIGFFLQMC
jgi:hypothetical protein